METVPCPISGSTDFTLYLQVPDRFDASGKKQWRLLRSCASGLIMLNPRPDSSEITRHYHTGPYDPHLLAQNNPSFRERAYLAARSLLLGYRASLILSECVKPVNQLSILEIGCSTGDLLNFFHRRKGIPIANLAGVEPEREAAVYARERFGLNISPALSDTTYGKIRFDRIILWHTLEHIHAIHETLEYAAQQLAPDGVLIIALPNPESYDAKHYRENWIAWDAPRHLYHFPPGTLEKLLEQHNLSLFKQLPYFPDTLYNYYHSEKLRCRRAGRPFTLLWIGSALCRAMIAAGRGMLRPEESSSCIYFARKKGLDVQP
jgi:2-polyprenyl-3-methyl-5-hydroxy-6-metoxy-1,4-benzoquinol methylase